MANPIILAPLQVDTSPPSKVAGVALVSKGSDFIRIGWNSATDNVAVNGYQVFVDGVPVDAGNITELNVTGLSPETSYFFQVRAYDEAGNQGDLSDVVEITTTALVTTTEALMLYGDIAADGTYPSGAAAPYQQMLISDTGAEGFSTFGNAINALSNLNFTEEYDQNFDPETELSNYEIVFLCSSQRVWSSAQVDAFEAWVRAGGRLILLTDSALGGEWSQVGIYNQIGQTARNPIMERFGMQFHVDQGEGVKTYTLPAASEIGNSSSLQFRHEGSSPIRIDASAGEAQGNPRSVVDYSGTPGQTQGITYTGDISALAIATPESGLVIALGDRNSFFNTTIGTSINEVDNLAYSETVFEFARDYTPGAYLRKSATEGFFEVIYPGHIIPIPDWTNSGVTGGIPDHTGWLSVTVAQGTGNDKQAVDTAISTALSTRADDDTPVIIYFPDGTYNLSSGIDLTYKNVLLLGESRENTILNINGASNGVRFLGSRQGGRRTVTVQHLRGDTVIDFSGTSGFTPVVGEFMELEIDQFPTYFRDKFIPLYADYTNFFDKEWHRNFYKIKEVNGDLVTICTPLRVDIRPSEYNQEGEFESLSVAERCGVENMTISFPTNVGGQWGGVEFEGAYECWAKDVTLLTPQSHPFGYERPGAKKCSIINCSSTEPHNVGAGGNGYAGFFGAHDNIMDGCTFWSPRHGPNFQSFASWNVVRNCFFDDCNGEDHTDWPIGNLVELTTITKRDHPQSHVFKTKWLHNTADGHDPSAGFLVLYNNDFSANDGGGISLGGLNLNSFIAYNKIHIKGEDGYNVKANPIQIFDFCPDSYFIGNHMWDEGADTSFVHDVFRFVPGFQEGYGQTGIGNWSYYPGDVNQYADPSPGNSLPINQSASLHFINNKAWMPSNAIMWNGYNTPATDDNNLMYSGAPSGNVLPDTEPVWVSLYQAQMDYREANPDQWT